MKILCAAAVQLSEGKAEGEEWDWDAYFLMRHHSAPTRLLDWSDGALIALHFAVQGADNEDAVVHMLEPDLLKEQLGALPDDATNKTNWKKYVATHPTEQLSEDDDARIYLPMDKEERNELPLLPPPLVLDFPHITRRVAAQRSRFVVFGSDPSWLASQFDKSGDPPIQSIEIDGQYKQKIRLQLRDGGVTESVIFPDLDGLGREMMQIFVDWMNT